MTEVFFSYSSRDKERVKTVVEAFERQGHSIFWDQQLPPGENWDKWIRGHIERAKAVIVLWSIRSIESENVQQEARIAHGQNKLVPALLDDIPSEQIPLGLAIVQCARLVDWNGEPDHDGWMQLLRIADGRVMPPYARLRVEVAETTVAEVKRRALVAAETAAMAERALAREVEAARLTIADLKLTCEAKEIEIERLSHGSADNPADERRSRAQLETAEQATRLWHSSYIKLKEEAEGAESERATIQGQLSKALADRASLELHLQGLEAQAAQYAAYSKSLEFELQRAQEQFDQSHGARKLNKWVILSLVTNVFLAVAAVSTFIASAGDHAKTRELSATISRLQENHKSRISELEKREAGEIRSRKDLEVRFSKEMARQEVEKKKREQLEADLVRKTKELQELRTLVATRDPPPPPEPPVPPPRDNPAEGYVVLLGSFAELQNARYLLDEVRRRSDGMFAAAQIRRSKLNEGIRYRVLANPPEPRQSARDRCAQLQSARITCSVVEAQGELVP